MLTSAEPVPPGSADVVLSFARATEVVVDSNELRPREDAGTDPRTDVRRRFPKDSRSMEILQILGTAGIVLGILVTILIAIVPTVVDR